MQSLNIVFTGKDQVEVRREAVASPAPDQILIEAQRSLISTGTEGIILGRKFAPGTHWDNWIQYPFYPGYCMAGRVLEVGAEVQDWKPGDRIAARVNHKQRSAFNPVEQRVEPIPDGVSDEAATWFGMAHIAQTGVRSAQHELGDAIVIIGAGLLGQLVTQYTRLSGARDIIVIDTARPRLEMAKAHGATHTLEMSVADAKEQVFELTDGRGADVVYDITGHPAVFASALGLARKFGKLLLLGDAGTPSEQRLTSDVITRGVRIIGAHDVHFPRTSSEREYWSHQTMTQLFFNYLQRGQMEVESLITHRYSPAEAPEAYNMLQTDRSSAMGVIFDWSRVAQSK
jgi:2-desacetyl-2-hydroxyethyl bacteriochlorophyllide A dehydrogenase